MAGERAQKRSAGARESRATRLLEPARALTLVGPEGDAKDVVSIGSKLIVKSLVGTRVELRPLHATNAEALVLAAGDGELWSLQYTVVPSAATIDEYLRIALDGRDAGVVMPYAAIVRATRQVVGSTRFWKIDSQNRKLEIGHTWLAASWQGTYVNTEAKYLMLRTAFEDMGCVRVQLTTDELNAKSRAAILKLGAKEEGLIRNERIMPNGRKRNSVRFSIIDDEWPTVRAGLEARLPLS